MVRPKEAMVFSFIIIMTAMCFCSFSHYAIPRDFNTYKSPRINNEYNRDSSHSKSVKIIGKLQSEKSSPNESPFAFLRRNLFRHEANRKNMPVAPALLPLRYNFPKGFILPPQLASIISKANAVAAIISRHLFKYIRYAVDTCSGRVKCLAANMQEWMLKHRGLFSIYAKTLVFAFIGG